MKTTKKIREEVIGLIFPVDLQVTIKKLAKDSERSFSAQVRILLKEALAIRAKQTKTDF